MAQIVAWGVGKQHASEPSPAVMDASAESIKLLHTLISELPKDSLRATNSEGTLQGLLTHTIDLLENQEYFEVVAELLCDAFPNDDLFLTREHHAMIFEVLQAPVPTAMLNSLIEGSSNSGPLRYARLLLAYCEPKASKMASEPESEPYKTCLQQLAQITGRPGVAIDEDEMIAEVLEFWSLFAGAVASSDYTSAMLKEQGESEGPARFVKDLFRVVIASLLKKVQLPSTEEWASWDSTTKTEFFRFRVDFMHFLSSAYGSTFGPRLFVSLGEYAVEAGDRSDWDAVEASFMALTGVADAAADSEEIDPPLASFFDSPLWQNIMRPESGVPAQIGGAAAHLVTKYKTFFLRNPQYLEQIISFLFQCLYGQGTATTASKTTMALCMECRRHLAPHAQSFVGQYTSYASLNSARTISGKEERQVKERLISAVTAVIQSQWSLPDAESQTKALQAFDSLLSLVEAELSSALQREDPDEARGGAAGSMGCLAQMGKTYRLASTSTAPIVLDDDEEPREAAAEPDEIKKLQHRIAYCCSQVLQRFPQDMEMMYFVCEVLRAGIPEDRGPFVIPLPYVDELLGEAIFVTPDPSYVLETIARMLRKRKAHAKSAEVQSFALRFLERAVRMVYDIQGGECSASSPSRLCANDHRKSKQRSGESHWSVGLCADIRRGLCDTFA